MDLFTLAWTAWIAAFIALEGAAFWHRRTGRRDETLSAHVWRWTGSLGSRTSPRTWAARTALLIFGAWLAGHWAFGWWSL